MIIVFNKYQGTGNNFIISDNRNEVINPDSPVLKYKLYDRRSGTGADGFIFITGSLKYDFEKSHFSSDDIASVLSGQFDTNSVKVRTKTGNLSGSFNI